MTTHSRHPQLGRHRSSSSARWPFASRSRSGISTRSTPRGPVSRSSSSTRSDSGARSSPTSGSATRATARSPASASLVVLGILVAVNYLSTRRNKRWDLTANQQYSLSEQTVKLLQGLKSPVKFMVFDQASQLRALPAAARRLRVQLEPGAGRVHRRRQEPGADEGNTRSTPTAPSSSSTWAAPSESRPTPSRTSPTRSIKVLNPTAAKKVYFLSGHGEKDPANSERDRLQRDRATR